MPVTYPEGWGLSGYGTGIWGGAGGGPSTPITTVTTGLRPTLYVEIATGVGPRAVPSSWTNISSYVMGFSTYRGRQQVLGQTEVGGGTMLLKNLDRSFDPSINPALQPMNRIRIRAEYGGVGYDIAYGYIRNWPQTWLDRKAGVVTVDFEDAFSVLARYDFGGTGTPIAQLPSGKHVQAVLEQFSWPDAATVPGGSAWWLLGVAGFSELGTTTTLGESAQVIDTGRSQIQALTPDGNLLSHLLNVAEQTEGGRLFVNAAGELTFQQRPSMPPVSSGNFSDQPGGLPYSDIVIAYDDILLYTDIQVQVRGDVDVDGNQVIHIADDATATAAYGPRTLSRTDVLFADPAEADDLANSLLTTYDFPQLRPQQLVLKPRSDQRAAMWAQILGREIGDHVTVQRSPDTSSVITLTAEIIGISLDATPDSWSATWTLNAAQDPTAFQGWILGTSLLEIDTRLGW